MKFEEALELLKAGKKVRRTTWGNEDCYISFNLAGALLKYFWLDRNDYWDWEYYSIDKNDIEADWEEYKESLLTKEEKEYLRMIIKFHPETIDKIQIYRNMDGVAIYLIYTIYADKYAVSLDYFKNLEEDKGYTLEELGLYEV